MQSKNTLAKILGTSVSELEEIADNLGSYYYSFQRKKIKPNGTIKIRTFDPSKGKLKSIQKRLLLNVLEKLPLRSNVFGGVKKRSNIQNARMHKGKKFHFATDLKDFFPSISNALVFKTLREIGFSTTVARIMTQLMTYKGHVPQGIPTSTYIANLVFTRIDDRLIEICHRHKITYTRFVDDLLFSSQSDFQHITKELIQIIQNEGFRISHRKTFYKIGPVEITGVLVRHNGMDLPDSKKKVLADPKQNKKAKDGLGNYQKQITLLDQA